MKSKVKSNYLEEDKEIEFEAPDDDCGPGRRGCAGKAARVARMQNRNRRNPAAAKRKAMRNSSKSNSGTGGGGLRKIAGLAILGLGAKAMKNYMDKQ
jgi:hypothetical protein